MKRTIISKGRTVDEAIQKALEEFNTTIENVTTKVIDVPATGLIGVFGNRFAKVEVTLKDEVTDNVIRFLEALFETMKVDVQIEVTTDEDILVFKLKTENAGVLIGKRGQTLDSIQYLASLVLNKDKAEYTRLALDIEDYREKRKRTLQDLADKIALTVERKRSRYELEPMNPYERRIIHASLQNYKNISTHSEGEEPNRFVVIEYKRNDL